MTFSRVFHYSDAVDVIGVIITISIVHKVHTMQHNQKNKKNVLRRPTHETQEIIAAYKATLA